MSPRRRLRQRIATVGAVGLMLSTAAWLAPTQRASATDVATTLFAEGGSFELNLINKLQADGGSSIEPMVPAFFNANVDQSRNDFAAGTADYAVSEFPLTTAQAATATQNHRSFAYVPFAASAVAIATVVICSDTATFQPTTLCENLQLTVPLLAKVFTIGVNTWNDPQLSQLGGGKPVLCSAASCSISAETQTSPTASSWALASLFLSDPAAKTVWDTYLLKQQKITDDTPSEIWPGAGVTGGDLSLAQGLVPVNQATLVPLTNPAQWGVGTVAPLPADWLGPPRNIFTTDPTTNKTIAIQNAAGKYVGPSSDATEAALSDATADANTNLVTFHSNANNTAAYPIDVMSYLIVPTSGLSPDKAKALSAFIKFVLGPTGQADVKALGDAPVTTSMVSAGLKVADQVATQQGQSTTATTTTTTTSTTNTTAAVVTAASTSNTSNPATVASATSNGAPSPALAFTGGIPLPIAVAGGGFLLLGDFFRRVVRRRMSTRASAR